jgi:hypothetical protein
MIHAFLRTAYHRAMGPCRHITSGITMLLVLFCAAGVLNAQRATPLTFFAIGDAGLAGPTLTGSADAMRLWAISLNLEKTPLSLLFFLGDNFYPIGLNQPEPIRKGLIESVLGPHRELMTSLGRENVHAVAGNHDYFCRTINGIPMNTCWAGNRYEDSIDLWSYHYYYPTSLRRSLFKGSRDSAELILFDSAVLLTCDAHEWRDLLDSLENILRASASSRGVKWRIIMAHHSPYTVGEHGGWRRWLPSENRVGYMGNCINERHDPFRYVQEFFSSQDNCAPRYRAYSDSLMAVIDRSGAKVQALMAGHDHSLQLLYYPERNCDNCPKVFVISGAGAKRDRVKSPNPPYEFSHPLNNPKDQGRSAGGFAVCQFNDNRLTVRFIDAVAGEVLDMGGTRTFEIDESGKLLDAR